MIEEINPNQNRPGYSPASPGGVEGPRAHSTPKGLDSFFGFRDKASRQYRFSDGTGTARREKLRGPSKWSDSSSVREFNLPWSSN